MKWPILESMNSARFLEEAFDAELHEKLKRTTRRRRNIYLWLFLTGTVCIFITALSSQTTLCMLSLSLSTLSLVVMTKYDTQLCFLQSLRLRNETDEEKPES
ncbi:MAG: hypothetical protein KJN67_02110 [Pontiella sp.]|nr:hypothetical protein [Pontiella sp.]MBT8045937.1 hypothetical protein [Pontiella sp.]NNJ71161.1 hypothetical protein [Kiritimatiellales bacterium]